MLIDSMRLFCTLTIGLSVAEPPGRFLRRVVIKFYTQILFSAHFHTTIMDKDGIDILMRTYSPAHDVGCRL